MENTFFDRVKNFAFIFITSILIYQFWIFYMNTMGGFSVAWRFATVNFRSSYFIYVTDVLKCIVTLFLIFIAYRNFVLNDLFQIHTWADFKKSFLIVFFMPYFANFGLYSVQQLNYKLVDLVRYFSMDIYERPFFYKDIFTLYSKLALSGLGVLVVLFLIANVVRTIKSKLFF